ncbi:MAG: DUF1700 domain-containing protein [Oscillospiraceae bacterium]|nr:DUF1700 domain-containing protein [Oscillospiraceae bacterium]
MHKQEFLAALAKEIAPEERQRVLDYYSEMIEDRVEAGEDEAAVIAGFGDMRAIAQGLEAARRVQSFGTKPTLSGGAKAWIAAACLFASPVALPVAVALLAAAASLLLALLCVLVSFVAAAAALGLGGLWAVAAGVISLDESLARGLLELGGGFMLMGGGILALLLSAKVIRGAGRLTVRAWTAILRKLLRKNGGNRYEKVA